MVTESEFTLVEKRLEQWNEKLGIANFRFGEVTKDEILKHVKAKDEIGQDITQVQLHYLRKLKERTK